MIFAKTILQQIQALEDQYPSWVAIRDEHTVADLKEMVFLDHKVRESLTKSAALLLPAKEQDVLAVYNWAESCVARADNLINTIADGQHAKTLALSEVANAETKAMLSEAFDHENKIAQPLVDAAVHLKVAAKQLMGELNDKYANLHQTMPKNEQDITARSTPQ